jgi:hypothetical protein
MADYNMDKYSIRHMMDNLIVKDVLTHMFSILDQCQLRRITKRRGINQAAYAVVKNIGYRSAYHDLYLSHPTMQHHILIAGEDVIPLTGVTSAQVFYRLMLLGEESKKGATGKSASDRLSGNATMYNQVEVDVRSNFTFVAVTMEMTGSAFLNMCMDHGKTSLAKDMKKLLKDKWGSTGSSYGLFEPTGSKGGGADGYRYVRLIDGVPKVYQRGWNDWVNVA